MLVRILAVLLLLNSVSLANEKAGPLRKAFQQHQIADNVYVIYGDIGFPSPENQGFMNNPSYIIGDAGVVVVDPGGSVQVGEMLMAHIAKTTDKPVVAVFNTHVHGDHWLGNHAITDKYPDVAIYAHHRVAPAIKAGAGEAWVELMFTSTEGATAGTRVVPPNNDLDHADEVSVAGLTFVAIHNDLAHTNTDAMLFVKEKNVVYLADNGANERVLRLEHGSYRGNIEALTLALDTGASVFVPGHGPAGGREVAKSYRSFLDTIYSTAKQGYDDGLADFELRPLLLEKLKPWREWAGFHTELGQHISGAYLEAEAADFD